jgi:hypothetical protein
MKLCNERLGIKGRDELCFGGGSQPMEATPKSDLTATLKDKRIKKINE